MLVSKVRASTVLGRVLVVTALSFIAPASAGQTDAVPAAEAAPAAEEIGRAHV